MSANVQGFGESLDRRRLLELMLKKRGIGVQAPPIVRHATRGPRAVSHAQQRLWFIDQLGQEGGAAYHLPAALRLSGRLNREALRQALDAIVDRHEVLRTRFVVIDGEPMQSTSDVPRFVLEDHDLSLPGADRDARLRALAAQEARARFDLARGPLIRGRLIRTAENEHVLLLTMHHIAADGWSMGVLVRELSAHYAAFDAGDPGPLPPLTIQYADYAAWQREWLDGGAMEHQLAWWKAHLEGAPATLELPTDRPRPAAQDFRGNSINFSLSAELAGQLKALANRHGTTIFTVLHTAFVILLSRLANTRDVVIGVPVANRQRTEIEPLIGVFVNTLALRTRIGDGDTGTSLLEQVKKAMLAAQDNQEAPFEKVVEALNPPRTLSHSPLFQVMLAMQNQPRSELKLPGLMLAPLSLGHTTEKFDLTVTLNETGTGILGAFSHAAALFDGSTIERWIDHYRTVLEALVQNPGQRIMDVPLLRPGQYEQVLAGFNSNYRRLPADLQVHHLFEQQVARTPDAVALVANDRQLTYSQLNEDANRLARYLRARGIGPDGLVLLCLERGVDLVVGVLAVLKAGGAYVPVDPAWPPARLGAVLDDAAPRVVLTQARLQVEWPRAPDALVTLDTLRQEIAGLDGTNPSWSDSTPANLAYVIYTSGSTGKPKGVMVHHAGVVSFLRSMRLRMDVQSMDCMLGLTTFTFDIAGLELYLPLICGARLVLADRETSLDPKQLASALIQYSVNLLQATPVTWRALLDSGWTGREGLKALCGGEALSTELAVRLKPLVHELWNLYGPTECTIWSTLRRIDSVGRDDGATQSIGWPLANTRVYILDERLRPVPIGIQGEIFIGGDGVARGYLGRAALTADRFLDDPFGDPGTRMYRTGDLGRWREDGSIDFLGRTDHQVKLRGFRIELGEIEAQLGEHAGVGDVAVVVREDVPGEKRLVAYYSEVESGAGPEQLRAHLQARLPEYMVPAAFVVLERLPVSSSGKLDRKSLPAPDLSALQTREWEPPCGEMEEALAAIWQELLNVPRVGRHDSFFDLGGHSMMTARMIARLQQLGLGVSLATVFKHPTLKSLAECLELGLDQDLVPNPILLRDGEGPPVFFVHEVSGDVLPYLPLARLLPEQFRVWGLQRLGIWHLDSLEQLAAEHIQAVRRVQPAGPYRLAGWSFGSILAYEMACQLVGADETVEFLGMIDGIAPVGTSLPAMDDFAVLRQFISDRWSATLGPAVVKELGELSDIPKFLEVCQQRGYFRGHVTVADVHRLLRNRRLIPEVSRRYSPDSLPLTVDFFDAADELPAPYHRRWESLIGGRVRRHAIGGTHRTITQPPHLQRLAAAMSASLETAAKEQAHPVEYSPLCPIQLVDAAQPTIFCIPGAGAGIPCFLPLALSLGSDFNVYGLQPRGLDGTGVPHSTVAAAAKAYLQAIRQVCTGGPYRLAGHSFGGWVAVEIARLLREQGEEVATVVLLDSEAPRGVRQNYTRISLLTHLVRAIEMVTERSLGIDAEHLSQLDNPSQLKLLRDRMVLAGALPRDTTPDSLQAVLRVFARNLNTVYRPATLVDADMALFQAAQPSSADRRREMAEDAAEWGTVVRASSVFQVPGNHMTMLRSPHVEGIVEKIKAIWSEG